MKAGNETGGYPNLSFGAVMKCFKEHKYNILIILTKQSYKNRIISFYMSVMREKDQPKSLPLFSLLLSFPFFISSLLSSLCSLSLFLFPLYLGIQTLSLLNSYSSILLIFQVYSCHIYPTTTCLVMVNNASCYPKEFWSENDLKHKCRIQTSAFLKKG